MLTIELSEYELYNEKTNKFTSYDSKKIILEHSLVSLYKWEAKWHIPFLHVKNFVGEQYNDYIRCMVLTEPIEPTFILGLTTDNIKAIQEYIASPMTASTSFTFSANSKSVKKEIITAEVIYSQMIANNIPFECQYWHLNQLTTLIKVYNARNNPDKMSKKETTQTYAEINAQRRALYKSKG